MTGDRRAALISAADQADIFAASFTFLKSQGGQKIMDQILTARYTLEPSIAAGRPHISNEQPFFIQIGLIEVSTSE